MLKFILKRLGSSLLVLFGASILLFALIKNLADDYSAWPSYIGIVLAALVAAGAWLTFQLSGESLPNVGSMGSSSTSSTTTPPAPPGEPEVSYARRLAGRDDQQIAEDFVAHVRGVGPDAHVASLFPEMGGIRTRGATTVGVPDAPKPPPQRVSLTLEAINTAQEVWLSVSGSDKAGAVGLALAGAGHVQVPAAGARGLKRTRWLIDQDAAQKLPGRLIDHDDEATD